MSRSPEHVPHFVNAPYLNKSHNSEIPAYSTSEFEMREEQYNYQIQKMSDHINQLEHEISILSHTNEGLEQDYYKVSQELLIYKDQLKKLFTVYQQQTAQYDAIKRKVQDSNGTVDKVYEKQIEFKNDVQNLVLDRDLLLNKLELGDKQYNFDIQSLTTQLNDKNAEIQEQRRKINDFMDLKRKAEEEIASLRFTLDHQTSKLEAELRERTLKLEALDKQFSEALYLKDNELVDAFDKIRVLEHEVRRILDLNRSYAQELSMLARDNRFKQDEIQKVRDDNKPQPQQITLQSGGIEPKMPPAWQEKFHNKIDACLDLFEKNHEKQVKQLCLNLWKCKMELQSRNKQNKALNEETGTLAKGAAIGGNVDFRIATYFVDSFVAAITFARDSIANIIFELFVKSINKANNKKQNSFILFYQNLKEMQEKQNKGLWLSLEVYSKLRKSLRHSVPLLIDSKVHSGLLEKVELAMGKLLKHDMDFRNNINKWLEGTLAFTIQKKDQEAYDKNRDYLFLFRMLTIKYRIKFPVQGKTFEVDVDIETFLEHKQNKNDQILMKLFSYYFRYSQYIPYQRTVQPEIILKNKLYDLTQEQQTNLKQFLQSPTVDQYQLQEVILHQQVCEQIKTLKSLSALKNISFFYLKLKFIDLSFWNTVATQYETIIGKISDITKVKHHMNSFVLLFSQLLRNRLITTEQIPLLKKCSQKTIIKLLPYYQDELLSNLIHAISAIGMFEIEDEKIINKLKSCVEAINISQYQLPEILQLHTSILKTNNLQLIDQSKNHLEDLIVMIKRRFGEVSPTDFGLCLWLSLRYDQPDLCRLLVMNMRELKIEDMSSLLRNAIKFKINLNKYFFFLKALKQQFDEYFQFEENDQKQILLMIKQFITLPFNLSPENQIEILKNKQEYSEYIINHCHAFDQERLSVTIQLANSFDNENQIIDAVTKYIRIQQADQFSIINLLIGLYMYKDQSTLIKEALERLAQLSQQNIPNYTTHYLQAMIIQYYGNTHPDICNQIKVNQNMVQHYLKMSQLEIKKTSEIHQLFFYQSMSEDNLKRYLLNNFEYNLYLLEKQNILKYDKEVKVDNYLVDYRIWDVRKDNLTNIPVQGNLIEFMTLKSFKYSSLVVDYRNDKDSVFIELEGPNHFNENGEQKNRTKIKHDHFKQLNLKVKYLALQEEVEIQECRNLILNLI